MQFTAQGSRPEHRWTHRLHPGHIYELGRDSQCDLFVPWDPHISRRHVRLTCCDGEIHVERFETARNPLFYKGDEVQTCRLRPGEGFAVGGTVFHVESDRDEESPSAVSPVEEVTFDRRELESVRYRDPDRRIEVLSHLPEVIWGARTDPELHHRLVNLFLSGVVHAEAVAVVRLNQQETVEVLHWERRRETAGGFRPSTRLVTDALDNRRRSVLRVWEPSHELRDDYTVPAEFDWAFCTPIPDPVGEPWGFYVAGRLGRPQGEDRGFAPRGADLQPDVKFAELVAEVISAVQRLNRLQQQQAGLRQFFAPPILSALGDDLDLDLLEPRECETTVLFCDLRGFSHRAEEAAGNLIGLLDRVSRALEIMTAQILDHGGVTADFQGDAALGFWGWPFPSGEAPLHACRAALKIQAAFRRIRQQPGHPLSDFETGIGIAHGRAVAGKIGTREQVKVTVFGPVVNLASRLEGMTAQLRVPVLLDEATTEVVKSRLDPGEGRVRRLGRVLPYGLERPLVVGELLPPESEYPEFTDAHLAEYEHAVEHFTAGRWEEAYQLLHRMPACDRAQDLLNMLIAQHNRTAPPDWDGTIRLPGK